MKLPLTVAKSVTVLDPVELVKAIMTENYGERVIVVEPKSPLETLDHFMEVAHVRVIDT